MKSCLILGLSLILSASAVLAVPKGLPPARPSAAAGPDPGSYVAQARRLSAAPVIDGHLDDPAWAGAPVIGDFVQLDPDDGKPATQPTEVRIGYDQNNLYFGIRCFDSEPGKIHENGLQRDADISYDDRVRIVLDTFHDRANGFFFTVNPLGARVDGLLRNNGEEENFSWDGLWYVATSRDDKGWIAEIAIPFKTLRFPNTGSQVWGFNVERFISRTKEDSFWTPMRQAYGFFARHEVRYFGELRGLEGISASGRYQATPYGLMRRDEEDRRARGTMKGNAGGDLKIDLTSDLVADVTVRTDFAEVEADQQQINLSRVKLYYPEKRPFFLEGANLFYFGDRIEPYDVAERFTFFFSRQIGLAQNGLVTIPVLGGAKLSGKMGDWSLGALNLTTDDLSYSLGGRRFEEPRTNFTVFRVKKDLYPGSTLGLIGLNKEVVGGDQGTAPFDYNRGLGLDWNLGFGKRFSSFGYVTRTFTPGYDSRDTAVSADVVYQGDHLRARTVYTDIGENFNPEMGFLTRSGIRKSQTDLVWIATPDRFLVHRMFLNLDLNHIVNTLYGATETQTGKAEISLVAKNRQGLAVIYYDNYEVLFEPFHVHRNVIIPPGHYRFSNIFTGIGTDYSRELGLTLWYDTGEYYNGHRLHTLVSVAEKPREGVVFLTQWDRNNIHLPTGKFITDLISENVSWSFSTRLSTRASLQWNRDDNFQGNFVLDWTYRPESDIYLVYNDLKDFFAERRDSETSTLTPGQSVILKVTRRFDF
jgi:hypothetical protein